MTNAKQNYSLNRGLVLHLPFSEGAGSNIYDRSPYGNNGTLTGCTWVNGLNGKALSFDGISDDVEIINASSLGITSELTISLWAYLTGSVQGGFLFKGRDGDINYGFRMINTNLMFTYNSEYCQSAASVTYNQWNHLVCRVIFSTGANVTNVIFYINKIRGVDVGWQWGSDGIGAPVTDVANLYLMKNEHWAGDTYSAGILEDLRIYNRLLSDREIRVLYDMKGRI